MIAIKTESLGRLYQNQEKKSEVRALTQLSLEVEEGEVYGLLGPNGAGKTTLVKILSTLLIPSEGTATILGHDVVKNPEAIRPLIGIVFGGDRGLYNQLTPREILEYWAALYHVPIAETKSRIVTLLDRVGLTDRADSRVETFSRGMKQRLHLARGLIANAKILFLDEPTMGMDPLAARDFRQLVKELKKEGRTILLTTHDMAEAEAVCDRVALIDHGRLIATETPHSLSQLVSRHERIDFETSDATIVDSVRALPGIAKVTEDSPGAYRIDLTDGTAVSSVLQFLISSGVTSLRTSRPSLEEVYIHLIGDRGLKV